MVVKAEGKFIITVMLSCWNLTLSLHSLWLADIWWARVVTLQRALSVVFKSIPQSHTISISHWNSKAIFSPSGRLLVIINLYKALGVNWVNFMLLTTCQQWKWGVKWVSEWTSLLQPFYFIFFFFHPFNTNTKSSLKSWREELLFLTGNLALLLIPD